MGFDDLRNTCLVLGLGLRSSPPPSSTGEDKSRIPAQISEPTLTLSLSGETFDRIPPPQKLDIDFDEDRRSSENNLYGQDHSGGGAASSFSNCSVKREREVCGGEEAEISERVSSRVVISDEDDDNNGSINGRKKLRLTKSQSALLEECFLLHTTLNPKQKQELARKLNLRPRQVEVWFQNRRARTKLKQTEVDCEFLKKCCETLTEENRRLQKELHELKSLKSPPLYMQFPAATLTVCPTCEKIGGDSLSEKAAKTVPFNIASKPHFYNPFTNPSAAC